MFERLALNWKLAVSSLKVLLHNKRLLAFPVISTIFSILIFLTFTSPFLFIPELFVGENASTGAVEFKPPWWMALVAFAYYFCCFFITIFFNTALMSCAFIHFNGGQPTLEDGLRCAFARLPQIAVWALVSATVMMILKAIQSTDERIARIVSMILGTVWIVVTYFVLPVLVVERVGPIRAIKRSVEILKQTWADAIIGRAGIGLFILVLCLPGVLLAIVTFAALVAFWPAGVVMLLITVAYFLFVATVSSAMKVIFCGALYQYAAMGQVPDGFDRRCLETAFGK
jgi:hypothetical protein